MHFVACLLCASCTYYMPFSRQRVVHNGWKCCKRLLTGSVCNSHVTSHDGAVRTQIGVLQWFARLWDIDQDEYWGYITNCGTEGNLHGILVGRENLPDGVLYASRESHYSVFKCVPNY